MALVDGLVSYWELEEASGTRVDSHGSYDLTPTNTPGSAAGIQGDGVDLESSSSQYLSTASSPTDLSITNDYSISFWWKPESVGVNQILVCKRDNDDSLNYRLFMNTSGAINFFAAFTVSGTVNITSSTTLSAGTMYHIMAIKSSTNGAELYINNSLVASDGTATGTVRTTTDPLRLGTRLRPSAQLFADGVMDEIGIWSKELDSTERADLYNSGAGRDYAYIAATGGGGGYRFNPQLAPFAGL